MAKCNFISSLRYFSLGSRDMQYVYKQKYRAEDARDSVIIAKLQVEYRQLRSLTNGDEKSLIKNDKLSEEIMLIMREREKKD